jgi:oligopeptide transport system substrate-binding protein
LPRLVWIFFLLLPMLACQPKNQDRNYFHLSYPTAIHNLNPILATDLSAYHLLQNIHEGLFTYNEHGEVVPGLLSGMQVSADGLTYTFYLKENLVFSDNTPLNAHDVYESWLYALEPSRGAPFAHLFDVIVNAKEYRSGLDVSPGIRVINDYQIEVELHRPFFFFLPLLVNPTFAVLSPSWRSGNEDWKSVSGAYTIADRELLNGTLLLEANPHHYAYQPSVQNNVKISFITNGQVAHQLFKTGQLDWQARNVPLGDLDDQRDSHLLQKSLANGNYFILINHAHAPFSDVRVREALSIAINRSQLADLLDEKPKATSYLTPFETESPELEYNTSRAQELLMAAGYTPENKLVIQYRYSTLPLDGYIASYLADAWQSLGVNLELVASSQYRGLWASGDFELIRASWFVADYEDREDFLYNFGRDSTFMDNHYENLYFEELLQRARQADTLLERKKWLIAGEEFLVREDFAVIGLFATDNAHLIDRNKWQGWHASRRDVHLLRYITLSGRG